MKQIVFVTDEDARYGFEMAGVVQFQAAPETLEDVLLQMREDVEAGMVVVDERLLAKMSAERFQEMEKQWPGLLIVLPAPEKGRVTEEDYALRFIRRAIGYHVRLDA